MDWVQTPRLDAASRVWALGLTFADHVRETGEKADAPVVFAKSCRPSLNGGVLHLPSQDALAQALHAVSPARHQRLSARRSTWPVLLDYEVELGLVLLDDWPVGQPMPPIGYVLVNDVTARGMQIAGLGADDPLRYWSAAKSFEGFLPMSGQMGCLSAAQAHTWPDIHLYTHVNGQLRQHAPLRNMLYTPWQVLAHAARHAPDNRLCRHDVVLTGTPAGIALQVPWWKRRLANCLPYEMAIYAAWRSQAASPRFLQAGDRVEVSADGFGVLQSTIQDPV